MISPLSLKNNQIFHQQNQWFGCYVSPSWWNYLWLSEGFASYFSSFLISLVYPEDRWIDTHLIDTVQSVLEIDANPNIRPMTYYVESPESIDFMFDDIASKKGEKSKPANYF